MKKGVIKKFTILLDENLEQGIQAIIGFKAQDLKNTLSELIKFDELSEIYVTSGEKNIICKARFSTIKKFRDFMNGLIELNIPFEVNIVSKVVKKRTELPKLSFKMKCDYCGEEINGEPYTYVLFNKRV